MNPRRPRTGIRRDGEVRRIRSEDVRYPGTDLPGSSTPPDGSAGLRPARNTGIAVEGRRHKEARRREQRGRIQALIAVAVFVLIAGLAWGWQRSSDQRAKTEPLPAAASATPDPAHANPSANPDIAKITPESGPTPLFATYKTVKIHLPVSLADLTEIGFHQASYPYAHKLKTPLPDADVADAKQDKSTHRDKTKQQDGEPLTGKVLRLWRNRPGKPNTSVDVGADPGSNVYAPVTGTVVKAVPFKLYNKYEDFEIHIQPLGHPELDFVMIHLSDPTVSAGDKVIAGKTRIAAVRKIKKSINPQLKQFTKNGGYHTHIQLNDTTYKGYKKKSLKGAITVDKNGDPVVSDSTE